MSTPTPDAQESKESLEDNFDQTIEGALKETDEGIFTLEKKGYESFGKWVDKQIQELEQDILDECGPEDSN